MCSRTWRVRGTNTPHPNTSNRALSPHDPLIGQWGQKTFTRETFRGATPTPPQQSSGHPQIGPRESALGRTHRRRNDTWRTSAAPCGNKHFVYSHTTVNSRAVCPVKMLQPAAAPRDIPSGSSCAARRYKYHARPSLSDRCKHGSKSPPPAPISRDARMLSTVKSSDHSHSRFFHHPSVPMWCRWRCRWGGRRRGARNGVRRRHAR